MYRVLYHSNSKLDDDLENCNLAIFFVFFFLDNTKTLPLKALEIIVW